MSDTVQVFRVECPDTGKGPYCAGRVASTYDEFGWRSGYTSKFSDGDLPCTSDDAEACGYHWNFVEIFGPRRHCFKDLKTLYDWFDAPRAEWLIELGYVLCMYTVHNGRQDCDKYIPTVVHFNRQSLFSPDYVVIREVIDWPEWLYNTDKKEQAVA